MQKRVRDDQEKLNKLKAEQQREVQRLKNEVLKKERENELLKRDVNKKDIFSKRKAEELNAMQQRQRADNIKRINANNQRSKLK